MGLHKKIVFLGTFGLLVIGALCLFYDFGESYQKSSPANDKTPSESARSLQDPNLSPVSNYEADVKIQDDEVVGTVSASVSTSSEKSSKLNEASADHLLEEAQLDEEVIDEDLEDEFNEKMDRMISSIEFEKESSELEIVANQGSGGFVGEGSYVEDAEDSYTDEELAISEALNSYEDLEEY